MAWEVEIYDRNAYQWVRPQVWRVDSRRDAEDLAAGAADEVRSSSPPGYCVFGSARRGGYTFKPDGSAGLNIREVPE